MAEIKWFQILKAGPALKSAIDALVAPGASCSKTVWYQLAKVAFTLLGACGVGIIVSEEELETISWAMALAIPAIATLLDSAASLWLRIHTHDSLASKLDKCTRECKNDG